MTNICRIAMWSGPRNISTAMMRSFENRIDTCVVDEPFYGFYLEKTGLEHPGKHDIISSMQCDGNLVADSLVSSGLPAGQTVYYQKHMTQHILPNIDLSFTKKLRNVFLLRDPAKIITSYAKVRSQFDIWDLGLLQQWQIYQYCLKNNDEKPIVIDSETVLDNPKKALSALCQQLNITFSDRMLNWPQGRRSTDGVWAPYWYGNVNQSTSFSTSSENVENIPDAYMCIYQEAKDIYQQLCQTQVQFSLNDAGS
jgi:hypothetical protein